MDVNARGERWHVVAAVPYADCTALRLTGSGRTNAGTQRTLLQPFDRVSEVPVAGGIEFVRRRRWWRTVRRHLVRQRPFGGVSVLANAAVDLLPYQLEPALAMLRHGRLRLLVADEVGLGKTIQAAAVLAQLAADEPDVRGLIVCPAGLRAQWRTELSERFGLASTSCDVSWLLDAARDLPPAVNPWALPGIHIASIDLVKRPEVLRALEDVTWDLAVFDEAHALSPGTARRAAAHALAGRSRRVILLTATPPDGDPAHMASLVSLGEGPGGDEITVFRRTRADAGVGLPRRWLLQPVQLSPSERRMHRLLEHYSALLWHEALARSDVHARLVTILLRKRALSSARSLAMTLDRRLALLGSEPARAAQLLLPLADEDPLDDQAPDAVIGAHGLCDRARERRLLQQLRKAADDAAGDESKVRVLARFLARAKESAIVFTEYRDTLTVLSAALTDHRPLQLHGEMPLHERARILTEFATHGGLLLSTDAASEGLNLQHQCRLVVHFELPWNPMRLEQRAGRVDRFGQSRRVHEVLLVARHTAERLVLAPLVGRLMTAQRTRGGSQASRFTESQVAGMILDGWDPPVSAPPAAKPMRSLSLLKEAEHETGRLEFLRKAGNHAGPDLAPSLVVYGRRRGGASRVTVVVRVSAELEGGPCIGSTLLPLELEVDWPGGDHPARLVRELSSRHAPFLSRVVREHLEVHEAPWAAWRHLVNALVRREHEIRSATASPSLRLVQAGLFDRRAQNDADERRRAMAALLDDTHARLERLTAQWNLREHVAVVAVYFGSPFER